MNKKNKIFFISKYDNRIIALIMLILLPIVLINSKLIISLIQSIGNFIPISAGNLIVICVILIALGLLLLSKIFIFCTSKIIKIFTTRL